MINPSRPCAKRHSNYSGNSSQRFTLEILKPGEESARVSAKDFELLGKLPSNNALNR
jgi:hypothetical protein